MNDNRPFSVVIPLYNEAENVEPLLRALDEALGQVYAEVILVDDGSTDGTDRALEQALSARGGRFQAVFLQRNFGQTAAMQAGIDAAGGAVIVTMDGDLQNDPRDIVVLVDMLLRNNLDVVSGWRKERKDSWLRRIPSRAANRIISSMTKVRLHDYGCTLKAYRADVLKSVRFYGEMHRFIPVWLATQINMQRIAELPVRHHARQAGASKYGLSRTLRVLLDLLFVKYFTKFRQRPLHFFGGMGVALGGLGGVILVYLVSLKLVWGESIGGRPLLLFGFLLVLAGIQFVSTGLLGEMLSRVYYEAQGKTTYVIRAVSRGGA